MRRSTRPKAISWRRTGSTGLTVTGYGIRLHVDRRRLIIEDGFANEQARRRIIVSRGTCQLQRIVVVGRTGLVTLDALHWMAEMGIALLFVGQGGNLISATVPGSEVGTKAKLHRLQASARSSEVGLQMARFLIGGKLSGQRGVLDWLAYPGRQFLASERGKIDRLRGAAAEISVLAEKCARADHIERVMELERSAGQIYWSVLSGLPLRWKPHDIPRVPSHWLVTQRRESYRTGNRYGATDPMNALLNCGYALLECETRISCLNAGLHPGLGIVHVDKDGRASFIYDLMEPIRPAVDQMTFEVAQGRTFQEGDCWETKEGFCRLDPALLAEAAGWLPRLRGAANEVARQTLKLFALG